MAHIGNIEKRVFSLVFFLESMQQKSLSGATSEFAAKTEKLNELIQIFCNELQLQESATDLIGTTQRLIKAKLMVRRFYSSRIIALVNDKLQDVKTKLQKVSVFSLIEQSRAEGKKTPTLGKSR